MSQTLSCTAAAALRASTLIEPKCHPESVRDNSTMVQRVAQLSPAELWADCAETMQSHARALASFPHLADAEFAEACIVLLKKFELHGHRQKEWTAVDSVSWNETTYLRITKTLPLCASALDASSETEESEDTEGTEETELNEDDDEVAQFSPSAPAVIHYDVVLSPIYRVPVLYFAVSDTQHRYPPTMDTLYSCVIPPAMKAQAEHVGVIGGITVTDHPATNKPVFFIHPCRTAEVMEASVSGRDIAAYDYLVMWIGAMGKCVGLNVPLTLVTETLKDN